MPTEFEMPQRPWTVLVAACLLLLIGVSGAGVGVTFLGAMGRFGEVPGTGLAIGGGLLAYGLALAIAGIGLLLGRRWAWWLGVAAIVLGLLVMSGIVVAVGPDPIIEGGILIWAVGLGALLARPSRDAVR